MAIKAVDQVTTGISRLLEQFKGKSNIESLLSTYLKQVNELEDSYISLLEERSINTAVGAQLDLLGALVTEPRNGRDDVSYRIAILTRVGINNSEGTPNQVLSILKTITQATKVKMWEHFPVGAIYYTNTEFDGSQPCVSNTLQKVSPATSYDVVTLFDPDNDGLVLSERILIESFLEDDGGNLIVDESGNFVTAVAYETLDDGRLEYSYLSEVVRYDAEVDPTGGSPEDLVVSIDGGPEDVLEFWSAPASEIAIAPYSTPLESCKSST